MKKLVLLSFVAVLAMTSCSTVYRTATSNDVNGSLISAVIADLDVSDKKITYTFVPSRAEQRAGVQNCINTAISEALERNGGGDVLVETQGAIVKRWGLFRRKVKSVTVTGYSATYKNFKPVDEETMNQGIVNGVFMQDENAKEQQTVKRFLKRILE